MLSRRCLLSAATVLLTAAVILTAPATSQADESSRSEVLELLSGIDTVPSADQIRALDDEAVATLRALALDDTLRPTTRARVVTALQFHPGEETTATFATLVGATPKPATVVLRRVSHAVSVAAPDRVDILEPLLDHDDATVRETTVKSLDRIDSPAARELLVERYQIEASAHVRSVIESSLGEVPLAPTDQPGPKE